MHTILLPLSSRLQLPAATAACSASASPRSRGCSLTGHSNPNRGDAAQIELPLAKSICYQLCHPNRLDKSICCHLNRSAPFDSPRFCPNRPAGGQIDCYRLILRTRRLIVCAATRIEAALLHPAPPAAFASAVGAWDRHCRRVWPSGLGFELYRRPRSSRAPAGGRAPPDPRYDDGRAPPGPSSSRGPA